MVFQHLPVVNISSISCFLLFSFSLSWQVLVSQGYVGESRRLTQKGRAAAFLQVATPALLSYRPGAATGRVCEDLASWTAGCHRLEENLVFSSIVFGLIFFMWAQSCAGWFALFAATTRKTGRPAISLKYSTAFIEAVGDAQGALQTFYNELFGCFPVLLCQ